MRMEEMLAKKNWIMLRTMPPVLPYAAANLSLHHSTCGMSRLYAW
jgi:hypothetical protein